MGGYGSGRYVRRGVKNSRRVTRFDTVDIRKVRKAHGLTADNDNPARVAFTYRLRGSPAQRAASAAVVWVPYPFGLRPFFACPQCGRNCCLLYLAERCACRQCLRLTYPVQFETKQNQGFRRAWKARRQAGMGHFGDLLGSQIPDCFKPKGMHWATFNRLRDEAVQKAVALWCGPIGRGLFERQERQQRRLDEVCARIEGKGRKT